MHETLTRTDVFFSDPLAAHWGALAPAARTPYYRALAEVEVGEALNALPPTWSVLHSVPTATGGVIPHLVIGPAGVFAIRAEHAGGAKIAVEDRTITVDGHQVDAARHAERAARQASRVLGGLGLPANGTVHAVLAICGTGKLRIRSAPAWGTVLLGAEVTDWLRALPAVLTPSRTAPIVAAAAQPSTWSAADSVLSESDPSSRFWTLHHAVLDEVPVPEWPAPRTPRQSDLPPAAKRRSGLRRWFLG